MTGIERLRELVEDSASYGVEVELRDIADQIEREQAGRLMPEGYEWPCYEDDKPVMLGDTVTKYVGGGTIKVRSVEFLENMTYLHELFKTDHVVIVSPGERVKRPQVLAADGEPIEPGQSLWAIDDVGMDMGEERVVDSLTNDGWFTVRGVLSCITFNPKRFTHQRPVTDGDGKPFEVGQTVWDTMTGEELTVVSINDVPGSGHPVKCSDGILYTTGRLTHQQPVLDADGNRIETAMDVWWVCEGDERGVHAEKLHVESIGEDGFVTCDPFNYGTWVELEPSELYVHKPVLGADGVPIKVGDTVWCVATDDELASMNIIRVMWPKMRERLTVKSFIDDAHGDKWADFEETNLYVKTCYLTHAKPERKLPELTDMFGILSDREDSWERVEEDMGKSFSEYWGCVNLTCAHCPAVIDGKQPHERFDGCSRNCALAMKRDLIRRCKKLAGVSE